MERQLIKNAKKHKYEENIMKIQQDSSSFMEKISV